MLVDLGSHDPHDARVAAGNLADFGHQGFDLAPNAARQMRVARKLPPVAPMIVTSTPAHVATAVASISANSMFSVLSENAPGGGSGRHLSNARLSRVGDFSPVLLAAKPGRRDACYVAVRMRWRGDRSGNGRRGGRLAVGSLRRAVEAESWPCESAFVCLDVSTAVDHRAHRRAVIVGRPQLGHGSGQAARCDDRSLLSRPAGPGSVSAASHAVFRRLGKSLCRGAPASIAGRSHDGPRGRLGQVRRHGLRGPLAVSS